MIKITAYNGTIYEAITINFEVAINNFRRDTGLHIIDIKIMERID